MSTYHRLAPSRARMAVLWSGLVTVLVAVPTMAQEQEVFYTDTFLSPYDRAELLGVDPETAPAFLVVRTHIGADGDYQYRENQFEQDVYFAGFAAALYSGRRQVNLWMTGIEPVADAENGARLPALRGRLEFSLYDGYGTEEVAPARWLMSWNVERGQDGREDHELALQLSVSGRELLHQVWQKKFVGGLLYAYRPEQNGEEAGHYIGLAQETVVKRYATPLGQAQVFSGYSLGYGRFGGTWALAPARLQLGGDLDLGGATFLRLVYTATFDNLDDEFNHEVGIVLDAHVFGSLFRSSPR